MRETAAELGLTLSSDPLGLRTARRWLMRLVVEAGFPPQDAHDLGVAFREACAIIHRHAYGGRRDGRVELRVSVGNEQVVVVLAHDGKAFDPAAYAEPDFGRPSEGGYGSDLMTALVDDVEFTGAGLGGRIVLVKRTSRAEAGA